MLESSSFKVLDLRPEFCSVFVRPDAVQCLFIVYSWYHETVENNRKYACISGVTVFTFIREIFIEEIMTGPS
jgi:hypothetical protein